MERPARQAGVCGAIVSAPQFGLEGEIQWPGAQPADGSFAFQVNRPGLIVDVQGGFAKPAVRRCSAAI